MTRRDYILLAKVLRAAYFRRKPGDASFWAIVTEIGTALAADNPRFDRNHFYAVIRGEKDLNSHPSQAAERA